MIAQVAGPILVLPAVLISYLTPAKAGGGGGGILAKDALGNDVVVEDWIKVLLPLKKPPRRIVPLCLAHVHDSPSFTRTSRLPHPKFDAATEDG